jgi:hypothetical protein
MQTPRAHRTTELMKEFARQGHEVTVYAVLGKYDYSDFVKAIPNITLKRINLKWMWHPYNSDADGKRYLIDKVLGRLLGKKYLFPNFEFYYRVQEIVKNDHAYDALISIADPHQIHWGIACYRKNNSKQFPKTWIADCGDPFMNNNLTQIHLPKFEKYEHLFCQYADNITVPEEEAKNGYYEQYRNKIQVIPQGFQFDWPLENKIELRNNIPTFGYAGNFYEDIRNPQKFMELVCEIEQPFKFIIYSNHTKLIEPFREKLKEKLEIRSGIPRELLLKELSKMDFLVNLANVNRPSQIPSKLIDYSIIGRPILDVNPINPNKDEILSFLNKDYKNQLKIENMQRYQIQHVVKNFLNLINLKNNSN